jgi:hypothetical protein
MPYDSEEQKGEYTSPELIAYSFSNRRVCFKRSVYTQLNSKIPPGVQAERTEKELGYQKEEGCGNSMPV